MKKVLILVTSILIVSAAKAQDLIVMKNAEEVLAKVTVITTDSVSYKKWSNLEGPSYTISKSNIFYIKYQNGEKDVFQEEKTANTTKSLTARTELQLSCLWHYIHPHRCGSYGRFKSGCENI